MKNILLIILFSLFVVSSSSCEPEAQYTYKVINKSNKKIQIIRNGGTTSLVPTYIEPNSEQVILTSGKRVFVSNYQTNTHLQGVLENLEIYQDSIKSKTDFSLSSKWEYKANSKRSATYSCEVYQSDF